MRVLGKDVIKVVTGEQVFTHLDKVVCLGQQITNSWALKTIVIKGVGVGAVA